MFIAPQHMLKVPLPNMDSLFRNKNILARVCLSLEEARNKEFLQGKGRVPPTDGEKHSLPAFISEVGQLSVPLVCKGCNSNSRARECVWRRGYSHVNEDPVS